MKLKYMLLGIGIGLILSSGLFYFLQKNQSPQMTDDDIMKRAGELGMVKVEELPDNSLDKLKQEMLNEKKVSEDGNFKLLKQDDETLETKEAEKPDSDTKESPSSENAKKEKTEITKGGAEDKKSNHQGGENKTSNQRDSGEAAKPKTEPNKTEDKADGKKQASTEPKTTTKVQTGENKNSEIKKDGEVKTYTYTVITGSSAVRLCNDFQAMGLIKDAKDFNNYLAVNNYATRIRNGTFTFTSGESYHSMAEKLVSRKLNP